MLDILFLLAVLGGSAWVAVRAYARPQGVYVRSVIGFGLTTVAALAVWWVVSLGIANEAGLGVFILFCATVALGACIALLACAAATLRHVCNALKSS